MKKLVKALRLAAVMLWFLTLRVNAQKLELVVQAGHTTSINTVVLSPDGKLLASGSSDASVKLWEVSTGRELRTLLGHEPKITTLIFTPDSETLVNASYDTTIRLWDTSTGLELRAFSQALSPDVKAIFSPDGRILAVDSGETITFWEISTGRELRKLPKDRGFQSVMAFSPNGKALATSNGDYDGIVQLWDVETGRELRVLNKHVGDVNSLAFTSDGRMLVTGGEDGTIRLWEVADGNLIATLSSLCADDWAVVDSAGRFDASAAGMKSLHYAVEVTTIALEQLKERYYDPGLLPKLLGHSRRPLREEKFVDVIRLFSYAQDEVPRLAESSGGLQLLHFMAKEGASFDIGMLERADRERIKLAQTKPFLLPPQLTNPATSYDNLELGRALREALREACLKNEINAVFVSAEDLPGAVRPSGTYQVIGNMVKVKMVLIKDGRPSGEISVEGVKTNIPGLVKRIIEALRPQIDKLLPQ